MSKKICVWGASITTGYWDHKMGGWVNRLRLFLEQNDSDFRIYNLGISGDITDDVVLRFPTEAKTREPSIVIFSIGINDTQYLSREKKVRVTEEKFKQNIKLLIDLAKKYTKKIIFVGFTPVDEERTNPISWDTNKNHKNSLIEKYNREIEKICQEEKLQFINIYEPFLKNSNYKDLLKDGVHPNAKGHQLIFKIVKEEIQL